MALTTPENVKQYLGITGTADDALLNSLIESASAFVAQYLSRQIEQGQVTEYFSGRGRDALILSEGPIASIDAVVADDQPLPASLDKSTGWKEAGGWLLYVNGRWPEGRQNIVVTYTAGYAPGSIPADIEQAVIDLVSLRYKERDRIGFQSKSLAGETVTFMIRDLSQFARTALNNFRKVIPQ